MTGSAFVWLGIAVAVGTALVVSLVQLRRQRAELNERQQEVVHHLTAASLADERCTKLEAERTARVRALAGRPARRSSQASAPAQPPPALPPGSRRSSAGLREGSPGARHSVHGGIATLEPVHEPPAGQQTFEAAPAQPASLDTSALSVQELVEQF